MYVDVCMCIIYICIYILYTVCELSASQLTLEHITIHVPDMFGPETPFSRATGFP